MMGAVGDDAMGCGQEIKNNSNFGLCKYHVIACRSVK